MAPVLDMKSPGVHQYQLLILLCNANSIHKELPLLQDLHEATNADVACIQETKLQPKDKTPERRNFSAVRRDRPVQVEVREGGLMIYIRKQIPYKISHPQANNSCTMIKIPNPK